MRVSPAARTTRVPTATSRPLPRDESISTWLLQLRAGDPDALQKLWCRYAPKVQELANARLAGGERRVSDDEDVLVSVFDRVWQTAGQGMIDSIDDKEAFEAFVVAVTIGKVIDHRRRNARQRRGGGAVRGDSVFDFHGTEAPRMGFEQVPDTRPSPEELACMAEESRHLLESLDDDELMAIAAAKIEGRSNVEIANRLDRSVATVERRLRLIRKKWEAVLDHE